MFDTHNPPKELLQVLVNLASANASVRAEANDQLARALELPLRKGVLFGDVVRNIFEPMYFAPGTQPEFPLDCIAPGEEDEFVAFTIPQTGKIPERKVEGDYVTIPTYSIGNSIGWNLKYAKSANWNIVARCMQLFEAGFVKKINDDGWHTVLAAVADRNVLIYDADATAGQFTKRLVSLMKLVMLRNGGGNSSSLRQSVLTDLFLSPESVEDIRNWNLDQVDEVTRREIYVSTDNGDKLTRIFGVNLHPLHEFGEGQEYQNYYTNRLGATINASDLELVVGLDMSNKDAFLMPYTEEVAFHMDPTLHRRQEAGGYGWADVGFGVLDNRRVIGGSY